MEQSPQKITRPQLVKKFPAFYGTRRFITAFTRARHLTLSWVRSIQPMPPHPTSWRSILISFYQCLGLASGLFPSVTPTRTSHALLSPIYVSHFPRIIVFYFITLITLVRSIDQKSSSFCSCLHSPVTLSLSGPNMFLRHPILEHPQPMFLPQYERPSVTSIQNKVQS